MQAHHYEFRLIDSHVYDSNEKSAESGSDDQSNASSNKSSETFTIQLFGINELGETVSIFIHNYHPFFFCKVPNTWKKSDLSGFVDFIKKRVKQSEGSILLGEFVNAHKLYGFTGGKKDLFVKLAFTNIATMNRVKNLWYTNTRGEERKLTQLTYMGKQLPIYECNIPPLLRYFHIHQISPSGWVRVSDTIKSDIKTTTCAYEYVCDAEDVIPLPNKETSVPYKICSFDIEASSSHGDFPLPVKSYKRLATNIVDVFAKQPTKMDVTRAQTLLEKLILAGFGFTKFAGIDLIYPIETPTKAKIQKCIQRLVELPIPSKIDAENTIESMFERMKEADLPEGTEGDVAEGLEYSIGQITDIDDSNILDLLLNVSAKRDEKIAILNAMMRTSGSDEESEYGTANFPKIEGDKVTFIGSTFMRYGEKEPYLNHCLVLGSCDAVAGATIETAPTEKDLLLQWTEVIQRENPDIIIGYNIFGFDYEFMFRRAQENRCEEHFLSLSRKMDEVCAKETTRYGKTTYEIENTKIVLASGEYDLRYFKMSGRIQIDMYSYFRRDFNLSSYKLDDVAGQYISDDVKYTVCREDGCTELWSKNLMGLHIGDFIHIEITGFSSDYYQDGRKFVVQDIVTKEREEIVKGSPAIVTYNVIVIEGIYDDIPKKNVRWGMAKDDVTPQDIFRLSNGSSADRAIVAKYCIQDCNLVHHLFNKIDVITGYVEMSRICSVPISFLVFRGQGIKLTSYVAKKCREKDTLMPDLQKPKSADGYEGAIVLPPKCGMYMDNPVACVDYSSLYPSSMISQNYSHDSKVWSKEYNLEGTLVRETGEKDKQGNYLYDNLPGYQYIDVEFDTYEYKRKTPTGSEVKTKCGKMIVRWAQLPNDQKSIMPSILEELLKARSDTRKMIKTESDPFMQNILDKRQLGYKVTANSLYGQCGARTSTFYEKDVAACTTATGRLMITYAKRMIEEVYGDSIYETASLGPVKCRAEYVYGDSVANYTPVKVRVHGHMQICTIEDLAKYGNDQWVKCEEPGKQAKEFCELQGVESWTEQGWTKIHRIIRHTLAPHKRMIRVLTHTGLVDVTDDHSLIKSDGNEISPTDCKIGTELLHKENEIIATYGNSSVTIEEAYIMGFFFGDGSCGNYNCPSGKKSSWALNNASMDILQKCLNFCTIAYPNFEWKILDTIQSSGVYKICPTSSIYGSIVAFVKLYRDKMYYNSMKIIPDEIMYASLEIRKSFWDGMYDADGDKDAKGYLRIDQKNQLSASHIAWLANSIGFKTSINTRTDKENIYRITMTTKTQRKNSNAIKKMHEIPYEGFVYDLTTENHHFSAGVGNLVVHNTDSVFFTFNLENPETKEKIRGKPALEATIEIAQDVANLCTSFLKPPMALTYEKTLMPFILLSKKRYVGMLYEEDPNKGKLKFMGLVLKRRDNCDLVKDVYGGILDILMKPDASVQLAIDFLNQSLQDLIDGKTQTDKLMITKALRSDYKNPQAIAHRVLADRMGQRDPGNKPKPGDRIKYIYVTNAGAKLQGDKIETPEYILQKKLNIDYVHYITNQLMKPLQQLFGLALEQIWEFQGKKPAIMSYRKDMKAFEKECGDDLEEFMKKKEKYCATKVKTLLFDAFLTKVHHSQNGIRTLDQFWGAK